MVWMEAADERWQGSLASVQVSSGTEQSLGALAVAFALGEQLSTKCSFLPLPFLFSSAPGPQATMDVHLGGQQKASKSSKGSGSRGEQQGHYPCVKSNNWHVMLNSRWGGGLLFPQ